MYCSRFVLSVPCQWLECFVLDSTPIRVNLRVHSRERCSLVISVGESSNTPSQSARSDCSGQKLWRVFHVEIPWAHLLMVSAFEMLREVVRQIFLARMPLYVECTVFDLIRHPK